MAAGAHSTTIEVHDSRTDASWEIELSDDTTDVPGWNDLVAGWSVGPIGSGARIELDEPRLAGHRLGLIQASGHFFLYGRLSESGAELPIGRGDASAAVRLRSEPDPPAEVRIDSQPLWLGVYRLRWLSAPVL